MRARFALGVFAGLLLGVVVISSAAVFSGNSFGGLAMAPATRDSVVTQTQTAVTTVTTAGGAWGPNQTNNQTTSTLTVISSSVSSTASTSPGPVYNSVSGAETAASAAQVDAIAHQPVVQSAVVFLPVIAAVLFGLILYRVSGTRTEEEPASA